MPFTLPKFRGMLICLIANIVGVLNRLGLARNRLVLLCPPVPEGNRGDQALLRAVVDSLVALGYKRIDMVQTSYHPIESIKPDDVLRIHTRFSPVFDSMLSFKEQLQFVLFLQGAKDVVLVGCDVLDEGYSKARSQGSLFAMYLASHATSSARIVGFSVNDTSSRDLYKRFIALRHRGVGLYARDAVTLKRLEDQGVEGAELVGDLAFLLQPASLDDLQDKDLVSFIQHNQGRLIGLNFTQGVMGEGETRDRLFANFIKACGKLSVDMDLRFVCIVHDDQGGIEYLQDFHEKLEAAYPGISRITLPMPPATHLKFIAGQCLHVFTCRLHLGIATLGMGRAVTGFPYQGKFEGQFRHFGLDESGLIPRNTLPDDADALTAVLRKRIENSDAIAAQVQASLPAVLSNARKNFHGLKSETPQTKTAASCL